MSTVLAYLDVGTGSQIAESLNRLLGTGNDDGTEAKEKPGERGGDCPHEQSPIHPWRGSAQRRYRDAVRISERSVHSVFWGMRSGPRQSTPW